MVIRYSAKIIQNIVWKKKEVNIHATEIRDKLGCMGPGPTQTSKAQSTMLRRNLKTALIWNCIQWFLSTLRQRNLKYNNQRPVWICVWGTLGQGNHAINAMLPFSNVFPSTLKRKAGVFKFLRLEERFRKAPFSWRMSVDGRPNLTHKAWFSYFSRVVRTKPKWSR